MKKLILLLTTSLCLVLAAAGTQTLEWTSGQLGGGWYSMAAGMSKLIEKDYPDIIFKVVPGGGTANPTKIERGQSQIGFGLDTISYLAANGKDIYKNKHKNISLIAIGLSDIPYHIIRANDSKYKDIGDLLKYGKNEKIAITKVGSSDEKIFTWIMDYYGTSYADLKKRGFRIVHGTYTELSSQYKDRLVDYIFMSLGLPGAAVIDMLLGRKGVVVGFSDGLMKSLKKEWGYNSGIIPANTYKYQTKDVKTGLMSTVLFTNNDVSTDVIYKITKSICENQSELESIHGSMKYFSCKKATVDSPLPIHPGAAKYYKEKGYIK